VTYAPHQGIHDWPYWRADLANAIAWGPFERPPSTHEEWRYDTVARVGEAWGLRFRFTEPPAEVVSLERDRDMLSGEGSGEVLIRARPRCRVSEELPFELELSSACGR